MSHYVYTISVPTFVNQKLDQNFHMEIPSKFDAKGVESKWYAFGKKTAFLNPFLMSANPILL